MPAKRVHHEKETAAAFVPPHHLEQQALFQKEFLNYFNAEVKPLLMELGCAEQGLVFEHRLLRMVPVKAVNEAHHFCTRLILASASYRYVKAQFTESQWNMMIACDPGLDAVKRRTQLKRELLTLWAERPAYLQNNTSYPRLMSHDALHIKGLLGLVIKGPPTSEPHSKLKANDATV